MNASQTNVEVVCKANAAIEPGPDDAETPFGSFRAILSTGTKDRDGEEVLAKDWELPLPARISMDVDHGMSVATTVGSGVPSLDAKGRLIVEGTYASTRLGQDTRALVNEGHISNTSVAFLRSTSTDHKGGKRVKRELLNAAFVSLPANKEALVLSSKGATGLKIGARNSSMDAKSIQAIHDNAKGLGAACPSMGKAMMTPGETDPADAAEDADVATLAKTIDDALDQACTLLESIDLSTLPEEVQQAIALVQSADVASDSLLDALGVFDPADDPGTDTAVPAAAKAAADTAQVNAIRSRIHQLATKGTLS